MTQAMPSSPVYAVILAGGSGTRFWPASRANRPKQYLPITGPRPMITQTVERLEGLIPAERTLVVTTSQQVDLVRECLPDLPAENLIVEPQPRNTAACVALAAFEVRRRDPDSVQVIQPADHVIEPVESFHATIRAATEQARAEADLITLGIRPDHPSTSYGYIRVGDEVARIEDQPVFKVDRFVEKPDRASAESFIKSGRFFWNSGIFVWRTEVILEAYAEFMPQVHAALNAPDSNSPEALAGVYDALPSTPVDKGILERAENVRMIPTDYRWNDVGSWTALTGVIERDEHGNWPALANGARIVTEDSHKCIAYAEEPELIALLGVEDLIVVRAGNATLVAPRDRAEDVRELVRRIAKEAPDYL